MSLSCTYSRHPPGQTQQEPKAQVHDRIDQLERLVASLIDAKSGENDSPSSFSNPTHLSENAALRQISSEGSADAEIPGTPDRVKLDSDATSYTNSGHWTSILDGVSFRRPVCGQSLRLVLSATRCKSRLV